MNDCLVKRLKGVVDNDNLKKLGVLTIKSTVVSGFTEDKRRLGITVSSPATISIVEEGFYFKTQGDPNPATERSREINGNVWLTFDEGAYTIEITNKYAITFLSTGESVESALVIEDLNDLAYSTGLTYLHHQNPENSSIKTKGDLSIFKNLPLVSSLFISGTDVTGTFEDLKDLPLTWLNLGANEKIGGNISTFANMVDLTELWLPQSENTKGNIVSYGKLTKLNSYLVIRTSITGALEDFVAAQCTAPTPRTSATNIDINLVLEYITFGGNIQSSAGWGFVSWENANKIFVLNGANNPAGCPNVFCKGYTEQEAEAKWPNKTIVRVDA